MTHPLGEDPRQIPDGSLAGRDLRPENVLMNRDDGARLAGRYVSRGRFAIDDRHLTDCLADLDRVGDRGGASDLRASAIQLDLATLKAIVLDGKLRPLGMLWFPHLNGDDIEAVQHFIRKKARASMKELAVTRRE
ncbi:MAG: hypothetical protein VX929_08605 [Pseudomonadota bacterium]|nr:hypothetical protein [Pseudomonadota bacterium]